MVEFVAARVFCIVPQLTAISSERRLWHNVFLCELREGMANRLRFCTINDSERVASTRLS